jgi:hypothetical protein|tara:strand:+ start:388 stop:582 length:195 start_codon:yes stop_codon:yes gene_type:complete
MESDEMTDKELEDSMATGKAYRAQDHVVPGLRFVSRIKARILQEKWLINNAQDYEWRDVPLEEE